MIGLALALAMAAQTSEPMFLKGACVYPDEQPQAGEIRQSCTTVGLTQGRDADDVLVQFGGGSSQTLGFAGPVSGETMTIRRIYPTPGTVIAATGGHCRIFYEGQQIAGLACVGKFGSKAYVANFRTENP